MFGLLKARVDDWVARFAYRQTHAIVALLRPDLDDIRRALEPAPTRQPEYPCGLILIGKSSDGIVLTSGETHYLKPGTHKELRLEMHVPLVEGAVLVPWGLAGIGEVRVGQNSCSPRYSAAQVLPMFVLPTVPVGHQVVVEMICRAPRQ